MNMKNRDKKGQVTLFIIVGIVIVAVVLVFLLWIQPTYISDKGERLGFEGCVEDAVEQAVEELGETGGFINPEFTYAYLGQDLPYLCYTNEYYQTCTVQKPFLKQHLEDQLEESVRGKIDSCYSNSIKNLKSQGYEVTSGSVNYAILLEPSSVRVEMNAPTSVGSQRFVRFNARLNSDIYEMLMISTSILQYETQLGDSDTSSIMTLYPGLIIDKLKQGDGTTVYILESKAFKNKFKFASRSLAWPAGYDR